MYFYVQKEGVYPKEITHVGTDEETAKSSATESAKHDTDDYHDWVVYRFSDGKSHEIFRANKARQPSPSEGLTVDDFDIYEEEEDQYFSDLERCNTPNCVVTTAHFDSDCHTEEDMKAYYEAMEDFESNEANE